MAPFSDLRGKNKRIDIQSSLTLSKASSPCYVELWFFFFPFSDICACGTCALVSVCSHSCGHVHTWTYTIFVWVCMWRGLRLVSGNFLHSYLDFFFEIAFLNQTHNCPTHLASLASLLWGSPASACLRRLAANTIKPSYPSRTYVGSRNLNSSCLAWEVH